MKLFSNYDCVMRDNHTGKIVFAKIIPAKDAHTAKQYFVKACNVELTQHDYIITVTKLGGIRKL